MAESIILADISLIIIAATVVGAIAFLLRQPLIGGYILAGILIGPEVLGLVSDSAVIQTFAKLGVAFLLFIVGLELDFSRLAEVRNVAFGTGLLQVFITFGLGFAAMLLTGFGEVEAIYGGLFVAFSSTAVLIKLLSDNGELDTLHGRITIGILLVQDMLIVLVLSVLTTLDGFGVSVLISAMLKGAGLLALAIVLSKYVVPHVFKAIDDSHELVFLVSLAVLFGFVGLSIQSGLSEAIGGFLAGIALTAFPYNIEIAERARSMRDFFTTIFFVSVGILVHLESITSYILPLLLLLGITIFIKPLVINLAVSFFRYGKKTSFYTGIGLGQISEFALIVGLLGLEAGHIGPGVFSLATLLMVITIPSTSYVTRYQRVLHDRFEHLIIEFRGAQYEEVDTRIEDHVLLCGAHVKGRKILEYMQAQDEELVVMDFDPDVIQALQEEVTAIYGDIEDVEALERASIGTAKTVISTVPNEEDNRFLLNHVKSVNPDATIIVTANDTESALLLYEEGADYVLYPKMLASQEAADIVEDHYQDGVDLEQARARHIEELEAAYERELLSRYEPDFIKKLKHNIRDRTYGTR